MTEAVQAVGHRLVVKPDEIQKYSKGGVLIVSDENRELAAQTFGTVVGIGPQCWAEFGDGTPWVEKGDRIVYAKYAGFTVKVPNDEEDRKYVIINDSDVVGKVDPNIDITDLERG